MELLTTVNAAFYLGLCSASVRKLVKAGKIKVMRVGPKGGKLRFTRQSLDDYLRNSQHFGSKPKGD